MAHTLTTDNGKEFAQCEWIAAALKLGYHFAHPHAAWERGANENLNGLLHSSSQNTSSDFLGTVTL
jgi:IS30 family transposase